MVKYCDVVPCKNRFCVCVAQKCVEIEINSFQMNLKTEASTKLFNSSPAFLSTKTPPCIIRRFTRKMQAWSNSPGFTSTMYHLSGQKRTVRRIF